MGWEGMECQMSEVVSEVRCVDECIYWSFDAVVLVSPSRSAIEMRASPHAPRTRATIASLGGSKVRITKPRGPPWNRTETRCSIRTRSHGREHCGLWARKRRHYVSLSACGTWPESNRPLYIYGSGARFAEHKTIVLCSHTRAEIIRCFESLSEPSLSVEEGFASSRQHSIQHIQPRLATLDVSTHHHPPPWHHQPSPSPSWPTPCPQTTPCPPSW